MRERTLLLIKPDAVRRRLIGEVIRRFEARGFDIVAIKMLRLNEALTQALYGQYADKDFYPPLCRFMQSGPLVALVVEGNDVIALVRKLIGATRHEEAEPGSIRGDFGHDTTANIVHGSDSPERAEYEIAQFFSESEIMSA